MDDLHAHKEVVILNALDVIHKRGFECRMCNKQNGHIQAISNKGRIINYYPTTETIAGYDFETVHGLDSLLKILEES